MQPFIYTANPARVVFGHGTLDQLGEEMERLRIRRAFVIITPSQKDAVATATAALGDRVAHVWPNPAMHAPVEVTAEALEVLKGSGADGLVAIGGGSAIGLSKALSLHTDLDQIVVPTTYAGSEMTAVLGQTEDGVKTTSGSPRFLPETVIYDVDLTLGLPVKLSGVSGMNAIAHAVEALVLGVSAMGLHHKLAHVMGGTFNLSHADTHTILLPHALAFNAPAVQPAMARMARALGRTDVPQALRGIAESFGAPRGLKDIGMPEEGIDRAAGIVFRNPYDNPRPLAEEPIRELIRRAWAGEPPADI